MQKTGNSALKRTFFSDLILSKSAGQRIAYIAVITALSTVSNMFLEIRVFDNQYSITIVVSALAGILLGPVCGFAACYLGDFFGYIHNSWGQLYMPWVGLSTGMIALIAGLIFNGIHWKFRGTLYVKLAIVCLLSLFICSIGINTTGFYYYYKGTFFSAGKGFSQDAMSYISQKFGTGVTYWGYALFRLVIKGQLLNSVANYALLFAVVPVLNHIKPLKIRIS